MVTSTITIKVNGLEHATEFENTLKLNYVSVKRKLDNQFSAWANRGLRLLGKILIYNTFGLSQVIYLARVLNFTKKSTPN